MTSGAHDLGRAWPPPGISSRTWPDALGSQVLHAALDPPDRALGAWEAVRRELDPSGPHANPLRRLFPLVWRNLNGAYPDHPDMEALRATYMSTLLANMRRVTDAAHWISLLAEAGVRTCVLKGLPLALREYGDLGARPMGDVDVMVPVGQVDAALAALRAHGWHQDHEGAGATRLVPRYHAEQMGHPDGGQLDLHWFAGGLLTSRALGRASAEPFWQAAVPLDLRGTATEALCRSDMLVQVSAHGAWRGSYATMRWVADAVVTARDADATGEQLDADRICELAERYRIGLLLHETMRYLTEVFDAPIPPELVSRLGEARLGRRELWRYRALTNPGEAPDWLDGVPEWRSVWAYRRWGRSDLEALRSTGSFLVGIWGLGSLRQAPRALLNRGWARISGRRRPRR